MKNTFLIISVIVVLIAVLLAGYLFYKNFPSNVQAPTTNQVPDTEIYTNNEYGFKITFSDSWKGYSVDKTGEWSGVRIDGPPMEGGPNYTGPLFVFKNPQTTLKQPYQDIPIMVFTHEVWDLVNAEKVAVSAAPIGPAKIGENTKYVFATPPRWYGFTDAIGTEEALNIVKTFKAF